MIQTRIIIIGAGPTGLMAAGQLARFDIDFIILDQKPGPTVESRAMVVTPRSMEIYHQMGLAQSLLAGSKPIPDLSLHIGGREKATFSLAHSGRGKTAFPDFQAFEQFKNEGLLNDFLVTSGNQVAWRTAFQNLQQDGDGVTVNAIQTVSGKIIPLTIRADFLMACDGASSPVRHALGMTFPGGTYMNRFFVADVKLSWQKPPHTLIATPSSDNFCAFLPMPGDHSYRILGTLPPGYTHKEIHNFEELRPVILETAKIPMQIGPVNWFATYQLHHRCVDKFRENHCFLLGDAAHIHSPAGGQGMNTGLQDAQNLAWKLALAVTGKAGNSLLNTYHSERYPVAKWLLKFTDSLFAFMTGGNMIRHNLRKYVLPFFFNHLAARPGIQNRIFMTLSQTGFRYRKGPSPFDQTRQKLRFGTGSRCPYIELRIKENVKSTYDLLGHPGFVLFAIGDFNTIANTIQIPEDWQEWIKVEHLPADTQWERLGVHKNLYLLIRPDQYIGLIADEISSGELERYFRSFH